jgi:hypothetical protein
LSSDCFGGGEPLRFIRSEPVSAAAMRGGAGLSMEGVQGFVHRLLVKA